LDGGLSLPVRDPKTERNFQTTKIAKRAKTIVEMSKESCMDLGLWLRLAKMGVTAHQDII
jgi:hypothetical protein